MKMIGFRLPPPAVSMYRFVPASIVVLNGIAMVPVRIRSVRQMIRMRIIVPVVSNRKTTTMFVSIPLVRAALTRMGRQIREEVVIRVAQPAGTVVILV